MASATARALSHLKYLLGAERIGLLNEALRALPAGTGQSGSDGFIERLLERDSPRLHAIAEQPLDVRIER